MTAPPRTRALPLPDFYDSAHAAEFAYRPDAQVLLGAATEWSSQHDVTSSGTDTTRIQLLLIDLQKDFCFPEGTLYVGGRSGTGAIDDSARIAEFIYRNMGVITDITCTMDTHFPFQIFFSSFWLSADDEPLAPHTMITTGEIRNGDVKPNPAVAWWLCNGNYPWLRKQVEFYCAELEKAGKYQLYLWPPHCLLGDAGHALAGIIHEARLFHAFARGSKDWVEVKGGNTLTENYSVLAPEVLLRHDGHPLAQRNTQFIRTLLDADAVVIAGQAASHCVKSSIDDLLAEIRTQDEELAEKVYILGDCMSSVAVPDPDTPGAFIFDFTLEAEDALRRFADAGMNVVQSTDPIDAWPGIRL